MSDAGASHVCPATLALTVCPCPRSLTHGGAIAAVVDSALGTCALAVAGKVVTANLSIDYLA